MKELGEIVSAFELLCAQEKPAAFATVIAVSGSAYRRPGARMLIAEDGRTWGGVSGGCLERDVTRRARGVIASGRPVICCYDTADDEDLYTGVATGCRGTVELFIEPLSRQQPGPFPWLAQTLRDRVSVHLATVVKVFGNVSALAGDRLDGSDPPTSDALAQLLGRRLKSPVARPHVARIEVGDGSVDFFFETLTPPQSLIVFGGGPDAVPLMTIAKTLGWHVTIVASRPATGAGERFAVADSLYVTSSADPTAGVSVGKDAAVVLMTHNFPRDVAILRGLQTRPRYLGILGPRRRTDELLTELPNVPFLEDAYGPIGLDLGCETAEEIALSVVAEIQAVLRDAPAVSLRDRPGPIHQVPPSERGSTDRDQTNALRSFACPA
jgi:xanthine dehydrogenase accessory factor